MLNLTLRSLDDSREWGKHERDTTVRVAGHLSAGHDADLLDEGFFDVYYVLLGTWGCEGWTCPRKQVPCVEILQVRDDN